MSTLRADLKTPAATDALGKKRLNFFMRINRFRIMAPIAVKGTTLHKHSCSDAGAVIY